MTVTLHPGSERMQIRIDGPLTVMEAAAARDQLALGLATAAGPVDVDVSAVTEIDTAGLQLLLALLRVPGTVRLREPSTVIADWADRLGLRATLQLEENEHGS